MGAQTPKIDQVLPLLYLHGFSGGLRARAGAVPRLDQGLSASTITRLTEQWQAEQKAFASGSVGVDYVYVWADGIHVNMRLGRRSCACWC